MAATYTCDRCGKPATHLQQAVDIAYNLGDGVERVATARHDLCDACVEALRT